MVRHAAPSAVGLPTSFACLSAGAGACCIGNMRVCVSVSICVRITCFCRSLSRFSPSTLSMCCMYAPSQLHQAQSSKV